jgi:hypothetical protein
MDLSDRTTTPVPVKKILPKSVRLIYSIISGRSGTDIKASSLRSGLILSEKLPIDSMMATADIMQQFPQNLHNAGVLSDSRRSLMPRRRFSLGFQSDTNLADILRERLQRA